MFLVLHNIFCGLERQDKWLPAPVPGGETLGEGNWALGHKAAAWPSSGHQEAGGEGMQMAAAVGWTGPPLTVLLIGNVPAAGMWESWCADSGWMGTVGKAFLPCLATKFPSKAQMHPTEFLQQH